MQTEALKLRFAINKIERLLSHNLALTDQALLDHVESKIREIEGRLGLTEIKLDHGKVDWATLIHAAAYRLPPFQPGEKEKGFRDALVAESFLQLVSDSPKTTKLCRVVMVTSDELLSTAIKNRITTLSNASVLPTIEELKGLINTLVSNVGEEFIAGLKPKADKLFFTTEDNKDTLYVKEKIGRRISEQFKEQLAARPEGTTFRSNGQWWISPPNFARKEQKRVFWASRIGIEAEAGSVISPDPIGKVSLSESLKSQSVTLEGRIPPAFSPAFSPAFPHAFEYNPLQFFSAESGITSINTSLKALMGTPEKKVTTHKGRDIYEVLWSTEVTMTRELKKAVVEEIKHIEIDWQSVS
jgi:hypothetical protein